MVTQSFQRKSLSVRVRDVKCEIPPALFKGLKPEAYGKISSLDRDLDGNNAIERGGGDLPSLSRL